MAALLTCITSFAVLDGLWLGLIAKTFYRNEIGSILRIQDGALMTNWTAAIIVYVALIIGVIVFVVPKAHGQWFAGLLWGALFGVISYAIYDFTNLAVLAAWQWKVAIVDTIWGGVLCGLVSAATVWVGSHFQ